MAALSAEAYDEDEAEVRQELTPLQQDQVLEEALRLDERGNCQEALTMLEEAVAMYPRSVDLERAFCRLLSKAVQGESDADRHHAGALLEGREEAWAKKLYAEYKRRVQKPATDYKWVSTRSEPIITNPYSRGWKVVSVIQEAGSTSRGGATLPGLRLPVQWDTPSTSQPSSDVRRTETPTRRQSFAKIRSSLIIELILGTLGGAVSAMGVAAFQSTFLPWSTLLPNAMRVGVLGGALCTVLGGLGGVLSGVSVLRFMFSDLSFREQEARMLALMTGAALGGLTVLLVAFLSEAVGQSLTGWVAEGLPTRDYAAALWVAWGMLGGLVWSWLYLREVRGSSRAR